MISLKNIIRILIVLSPILVLSQTNKTDSLPKRNTVYIEFLGQGIISSFNFDRLFHYKKVRTSLSFGLVLTQKYHYAFTQGAYFGVPVSYGVIFGKKKHHLETGIGFTFLSISDVYSRSFFGNPSYYTYLSPKLAYRFQKPEGGLFLKITAYTHIGLVNYIRNTFISPSPYQYFENVAGQLIINNSGSYINVLPWPGISLGYTIEK